MSATDTSLATALFTSQHSSASAPQPSGHAFGSSRNSVLPDTVVGPSSSLKRPALPDCGDEDNASRKRMRENARVDNCASVGRAGEQVAHAIDGQALVADLAQELQCGCCSELVYKPVIVSPCEHFFCGSCCTLWIKNGGTNCPACRTASTIVTPSRAIQSMVDVLLRAAPHLQRTERERMQADEIYPTLRIFRIPVPREPSPEPAIPAPSDYLQPCPHCAPNNQFNWTCPQPITDPAADAEHAWSINDGVPPGHAFCGNCESVLALQAPSTTRCDFCQVSFCGINVQGRCCALGLTVQSPQGLSDMGDLIQSTDVYDCFDGNTAEVDLLLDYMTSQRLSPKHIYRQIAAYIQSQPNGFQPLLEQDLFVDMHAVSGGTDPDPSAPRRYICRVCASEVFLYGIRDWWIRERRKAILEGLLRERKDCPQGRLCNNVNDPAHAREFNHLIASPEDGIDIPMRVSSGQHSGPSSLSSAPEPVSNNSSFASSTSTLSIQEPLVSSTSQPDSLAIQHNDPSSFAPQPTTLPSIAELVFNVSSFSVQPHSNPMHSHSGPTFVHASLNDYPILGASHQFEPVNHLRYGEAAPPVINPPWRNSNRMADEDVDLDELPAPPASSQSQREVEAALNTSSVSEADESRPGEEDTVNDFITDDGEDYNDEACIAAATAAHTQFGIDVLSIRHRPASGSIKINIDEQDHSHGHEESRSDQMEGFLPIPPSQFPLPPITSSALPSLRSPSPGSVSAFNSSSLPAHISPHAPSHSRQPHQQSVQVE